MKPPDACFYIQNKSYFLPPPADGFPDGGEELATPCWCLRTQEPVGPDGKRVAADACRKGRACYRPEVEL